MNDKSGLFALVLLMGLSFFGGALVKTMLDSPAPRPSDVIVPYYHCPDPEHQQIVDPRSWREGKFAESKYRIAKDVPAR